MTIELPPAVAGFFAADRDQDAAALPGLFTENAVVKDEGRVHTGHEAITAWLADSWKRYDAKAEPFAITEQGKTTVVTSHVAGNFAGSPIDLRFHFVLEGGRIAQLETTS